MLMVQKCRNCLKAFFIHRGCRNIFNNKNSNIINRKINSSFRIYVLCVCSFLAKTQKNSQGYRVSLNSIFLADIFSPKADNRAISLSAYKTSNSLKQELYFNSSLRLCSSLLHRELPLKQFAAFAPL